MTREERAAQAEAEQEAALQRGDIPIIGRQRGQGVIDPRDQFAQAPEYTPQHLPAIYEAYVGDCIASWGGDPGAYACSFMAMHCGVLHSSVKMNTNPLKPNNFRNPNDFSLTLGKSGENKSGMFKDLTRHQESWQKAMTRAQSKVTSVRKAQPPMCFLQNASIEGLMMQIADNKGDRLLMGSEEAMSFYDGAALHHKDNSANAMSNAVCQVYDGGMFSKRLVNKAYSIPEALATLIMTTTIDKVANWKSFSAMVDSGLMARHTVGLLAYPQPRDQTKLIEGADVAMGDVLLKMRGLRDVRLVLAPNARQPWLNYTAAREEANVALVTNGAKIGLINWIRKYDMRIMTMASILQLYEYIEGGQMDSVDTEMPLLDGEGDKSDGGTKMMKTISISKANLSRAIDFIEGYLYEMQEFFYTVAAGQTEFGMELLNFISYRVTIDEPDNPAMRIIPREMFTHSGPAVCRGALNDERKELWKRYIQALLDHGYIEVYESPTAKSPERNKRKPENEQPHYKVRDEVFEYFESEESRNWLKAVYTKSRQAATGEATRKRLSLE
jgi:Protein of unknown function (DUF3987)